MKNCNLCEPSIEALVMFRIYKSVLRVVIQLHLHIVARLQIMVVESLGHGGLSWRKQHLDRWKIKYMVSPNKILLERSESRLIYSNSSLFKR